MIASIRGLGASMTLNSGYPGSSESPGSRISRNPPFFTHCRIAVMSRESCVGAGGRIARWY